MQPSEPDTHDKSGGGVGRVVRGLVVLVVVGVIIIVVARSLSIGDDDGPNPDATPDTTASPAAGQRLPMEPGSSATIIGGRDGEQRSLVTLGEVLDPFEHPSNQFSLPAPGNRWWGIHLTVENTGQADAPSLRYRLRLADNAEYEPRFIAGVPGMLEYSYSNLAPGVRESGWLFFEIPGDATVEALRVEARDGVGGRALAPVNFEVR
jgi:hypothetical protein